MPPPADELIPRLFLGPALRTQSDRRLVRLVRDGYETAFEEIVRRYGGPLRGYAAAIVGGHADDVTQDSFAKALQALRRDGGGEIELRPWLYRIVRNTALNDLRDRPRQAEELAEAIAGGRSTAEEAEQREDLTELMKRLQALPEPQRAAIVMRELEGLGHEEIAAALGITGGAARQAIHRGRTALRDAAGFLVPIPLLRLLLEHGAEAGVAIGAGGAAGATVAGAAAGGAGGGTALKASLATALIAGSVGTGVALKEDREKVDTSGPPAARTAQAPPPAPASAPRSIASESNGSPAPESSGSSSGPGSSSGSDDSDDSGSRHEREDRREGREDRDRSGSNSGPGSGEQAHEHDEDDERDHSGPGSGEEIEFETDEDDDDSSGPGGGD